MKLNRRDFIKISGATAPFIVGESYGFKNGLFSDYKKNEEDPALRGYDKSKWGKSLLRAPPLI